MLLAETSDTVQIATLVIAFMSTVFTGVMTYLIARLNNKTDAAAIQSRLAAVKVKEVKEKLDETTAAQAITLAEIASTGEKTHTLVNSAMGAQLQLHARTARAKAEITRDRVDVIAAETAEALYTEHVRKQRSVDQAAAAAAAAAAAEEPRML